MIEETAPAKINLCLHVGPRRNDGLHEIESLFVFADDGDRVAVAPDAAMSLDVIGPFDSALAPFPVQNNLVWRAAETLRRRAGVTAGAAITLDKRLPVAAGVGGGSADAAAALRALCILWEIREDECGLRALAFGLGADVPACLDAAPVYVSGAGEVLAPGPHLPPLWVCLVNARQPVPTGPVFQAFDRANPAPPPAAPAPAANLHSYEGVKAYFASTTNDLEPFAVSRCAAIGVARDFLAEWPGCIGARMSGSGGTVFGLFTSSAAAMRAAQAASSRGWWSMAAKVSGRGRVALAGAGS